MLKVNSRNFMMFLLKKRNLIILFFYLFISVQVSASSIIFNKHYKPHSFILYKSRYEKNLILDISSGRINTRGLIKAGLTASGVADKKSQKIIRNIFYRKFSNLNKSLKKLKLNRYNNARKILELTFKYFLKNYQTERTTLIDAIAHKNFNCVSASILFNIIALKHNYKTRAVLVPGHVYSQIYINNKWIDVETTNKLGFHPYRNRFAKVLDKHRGYIKDKGKGKRHYYITNAKLLSLILYNRGSIELNKNNFSEAARFFLQALKIFPKYPDSVKGFFASMMNWIGDEIKKDNFRKSLMIIEDSISAFGRNDKLIRLMEHAYHESAKKYANLKMFSKSISLLGELISKLPKRKANILKYMESYYYNWADQNLKKGNFRKIINILDAGLRRWKIKKINSFKIHFITQAAKKIMKTKGLKEGFNFFNENIPKYNESRSARNNRQFLLDKWARTLLNIKKYQKAYIVYKKAINLYPNSKIFKSNLSYSIQNWIKEIINKNGKGLREALKYYKKYNDKMILTEMVNMTIQKAYTLMSRGNYIEAENIAVKILNMDKKHNKKVMKLYRMILFNHGVISFRNGLYEKAIGIYKKALKIFHNDTEIKKNLSVFYANYTITLLQKGKRDYSKKILMEALRFFPGNKKLLSIKKYFEK